MLHEIQAELKAPKGQKNTFGNYKYRSCEDIVEAVKPILKRKGVSLILTDDMVMLGDRFYIKATARLVSGDVVIGESNGYAREQESKKGMDEAQITGAASSYARKYALNGLLAIDDTKDADTLSPEDNEKPVQRSVAAFKDSISAIKEGISKGDLSTASEEWFTLSEEAKTIIWTAPTKGGPFTTVERDIIKSTEFRQAYFGAAA